MVVVGDRNGTVGYGYGKANDVPDAIRKGVQQAKRNMITVPRQAHTIPYTVQGKFDGSKVLLKPATPGTGIIAGGSVRAVMEMCGINDVLSKSLGSQNAVNVVRAVFNGLQDIMTPWDIAKRRGKTVRELWG